MNPTQKQFALTGVSRKKRHSYQLSLGGLLAVLTCLWPMPMHAETTVQAWVQRYSNPTPINSNDQAQKVVTDSVGNVIVAGQTDQAGSQKAILTIKYSAMGTALWTNLYGPSSSDATVTALTLDTSANIFVTGYSSTALGNYGRIVKYNTAGTPLWTNGFWVMNYYIKANAAAVDSGGNVIITGTSTPISGMGTTYCLTIKCSAAGARLWTNLYTLGGYASGAAVAVDSSDNAYVTGTSGSGSTGYATIKYSPSGTPL